MIDVTGTKRFELPPELDGKSYANNQEETACSGFTLALEIHLSASVPYRPSSHNLNR